MLVNRTRKVMHRDGPHLVVVDHVDVARGSCGSVCSRPRVGIGAVRVPLLERLFLLARSSSSSFLDGRLGRGRFGLGRSGARSLCGWFRFAGGGSLCRQMGDLWPSVSSRMSLLGALTRTFFFVGCSYASEPESLSS